MIRLAVRRVVADGRDARVAAGLSQRAVAGAIGTTHMRIGRLERNENGNPPLDLLGAYCAVVGLDLGLRAYPAGDPIRDRAHVALLDRLHRELSPGIGWRTEVPLPIDGDRRAWDAVIRGAGWQIAVEAETAVADAQALERKLALKLGDGGFDHVIVLVADTERNRKAVPAMRGSFPLATRSLLAALREGRDPGASGIVML